MTDPRTISLMESGSDDDSDSDGENGEGENGEGENGEGENGEGENGEHPMYISSDDSEGDGENGDGENGEGENGEHPMYISSDDGSGDNNENNDDGDDDREGDGEDENEVVVNGDVAVTSDGFLALVEDASGGAEDRQDELLDLLKAHPDLSGLSEDAQIMYDGLQRHVKGIHVTNILPQPASATDGDMYALGAAFAATHL